MSKMRFWHPQPQPQGPQHQPNFFFAIWHPNPKLNPFFSMENITTRTTTQYYYLKTPWTQHQPNSFKNNHHNQTGVGTKHLLTKRLLTKCLLDKAPTDKTPTGHNAYCDKTPTRHNAYWTKCLLSKCLPWQNAYRNTFRNVNKSEGPTLGK